MITKEEAFVICDHMQKTLDIEEMIMLVHAYEKMKAIAEGKDEEVIEQPKKASGRKKIDLDQVRAMYNSGMSQKDIAKQLGYTPAYISSVFKEAGLRDGRLDKGKVMALHKAGWSQKDIAGEMGCTEQNIKDIIKELKDHEQGV